MYVVPWTFLIGQGVIVVASLLGYGIFTARPDLLAQVDPGARFFVWAFQGFAVGNMLLGGVAVVAEAVLRNGSRVLLACGAVYLVSLTSELLGTTYGIPFGAYSYTALLGTKWFDKVPLVIPLSWVTMSWAVWVVARRWSQGFAAVIVGTSLLVAWDLLLDPAMSKVTSYWVWGEEGAYYYGMPWINLAGWGITGFVLLAMLWKLAPAPCSSVRFAAWVYIINFSLPLGFCILNGYWLAVAAGSGSAGLALLMIARFGRSQPTSSSASVASVRA